MTKELASKIAETFNSKSKSYVALVGNVNGNYTVSIHCEQFIPTTLLNNVQYIADNFDVLPYIHCFDNEMCIEIAC